MKYLQGLRYVKPLLKKLKPTKKTITNPISGKTLTKCNSEKDCNTSLNLVLENFDIKTNPKT